MFTAEDDDDDENFEDSFAYLESSLLRDDIAHGSAKSVDMSHRINIGEMFNNFNSTTMYNY